MTSEIEGPAAPGDAVGFPPAGNDSNGNTNRSNSKAVSAAMDQAVVGGLSLSALFSAANRAKEISSSSSAGSSSSSSSSEGLSHPSEASLEKALVTESAYLLFYQRKHISRASFVKYS